MSILVCTCVYVSAQVCVSDKLMNELCDIENQYEQKSKQT